MKKIHAAVFKEGTERRQTALRGGEYSLIATACVLALVVLLNVLVNLLPVSWTRYDISAAKLYSVTSHTKMVVNQLEEDVTIYWLVQSGQEDQILENLLAQYDSLSEYVTVVKKNPDVYPTFAQQYTSEPVQNNSLVVECGERSRYIALDEIYLYTMDMNGQYQPSSFDGEGAITSAIDYVTNEDQPQILLLEGHGEQPLPEAFADQIEKANIGLGTISLLKVDMIPEDADALMIYAPSSDFSPEEVEMLYQYTQQGGRLFVAAGPVESGTLSNLYSLLERYGVTTVDGVIVESDRERYAIRQPYLLIPDMENSPLTEPLIEERYAPVFPIAQGLLVGTAPAGVEVTELLTVTDSAFSKADGYQLTTYEKEEGDLDGPFALAVDIHCGEEGEMVWFASSDYMEELYNLYSSGANVELSMNAVASLIGESEAMAIRSKSLHYDYLTISESNATLLKTLMIGVVPLTYLGIGVFVMLERRKKYRETI